MIVAEIVIPQMFTAYAEDKGYLENGLHHFQYYCEECDQAFSSAWGRIPGSMQWYERGNHFHCPQCGEKHERNVICVKSQVQVPNKISLRVKVYQNAVVFEVIGTTVEFRDFLRVYGGKYKESFRFNIAEKSVLFSRYENGCEIESFEIGNPFKLEVFKKSILSFFLSNSLANARQKKDLNRILKVLRDRVHDKLEKHLGYKVSSMFVSPGKYHGSFLLPIFNMAYRVRFPDAPNLPVTYRGDPKSIKQFWETKMINDYDFFMDEVIALTKRKIDFVTAIINLNGLPNKTSIRRILSEDPFEASFLNIAFKVCKNYDVAMRLFSGFKKLWAYEKDELIQFLHEMLPVYGETGIAALVGLAKELELRDCIRLYQQLNDENKQLFQTKRVKLRNLHDWLALRHRQQTHVNLKFDVPEHIIKRLSMQTDRLKFFLPEESMELLEAGVKLHNCVASYGKDMKANSKWVVLVTDGKGKLTACLEVQGKVLVQAKINGNKPAANNTELNNSVVAWAKEAKLEIKTTDLNAKEVIEEAS